MNKFRNHNKIVISLLLGLFYCVQPSYAGPRGILGTESNRFDKYFAVNPSVTIAHSELHECNHFEVHVETEDTDAANIICAFRIPAGKKRVHVVIDWKAEDKAHMEIFEGAIWSTNTGEAITIYNNNRNCTNTSQLEEDKTATPLWTANGVLKNPTGVTGGITLHPDYSYVSKQAGGATSLPRHEWVLKNDETYVLKITNDAGGNKGMGIVLHYYEHTDR